MPEEASKSVVRISNEPATGSEPAHVAVTVDGANRYTIRSSDLEAIGAQLRGKKSFSFFNSIVVPAVAVLATTLIAQLFQYISWRNSTRLQETTERAVAARVAYEQVSKAMSARYYATKLYLDAVAELNRKADAGNKLSDLEVTLNQARFNEFEKEMGNWYDSYDQLLNDIDFKLDRPVLWHSERTSVHDFKDNKYGKLRCDGMLMTELPRLHLNVNSVKVQFAAINYCFSQSLVPFNFERTSAITKADYVVSQKVKDDVAQANEDVRSMTNEFRCYAQHRIALFEQQRRKSIFKLSRWFTEKISALFGDPSQATRDALKTALDECDYTKTVDNKGRFASGAPDGS